MAFVIPVAEDPRLGLIRRFAEAEVLRADLKEKRRHEKGVKQKARRQKNAATAGAVIGAVVTGGAALQGLAAPAATATTAGTTTGAGAAGTASTVGAIDAAATGAAGSGIESIVGSLAASEAGALTSAGGLGLTEAGIATGLAGPTLAELTGTSSVAAGSGPLSHAALAAGVESVGVGSLGGTLGTFGSLAHVGKETLRGWSAGTAIGGGVGEVLFGDDPNYMRAAAGVYKGLQILDEPRKKAEIRARKEQDRMTSHALQVARMERGEQTRLANRHGFDRQAFLEQAQTQGMTPGEFSFELTKRELDGMRYIIGEERFETLDEANKREHQAIIRNEKIREDYRQQRSEWNERFDAANEVSMTVSEMEKAAEGKNMTWRQMHKHLKEVAKKASFNDRANRNIANSLSMASVRQAKEYVDNIEGYNFSGHPGAKNRAMSLVQTMQEIERDDTYTDKYGRLNDLGVEAMAQVSKDVNGLMRGMPKVKPPPTIDDLEKQGYYRKDPITGDVETFHDGKLTVLRTGKVDGLSDGQAKLMVGPEGRNWAQVNVDGQVFYTPVQEGPAPMSRARVDKVEQTTRERMRDEYMAENTEIVPDPNDKKKTILKQPEKEPVFSELAIEQRLLRDRPEYRVNIEQELNQIIYEAQGKGWISPDEKARIRQIRHLLNVPEKNLRS